MFKIKGICLFLALGVFVQGHSVSAASIHDEEKEVGEERHEIDAGKKISDIFHMGAQARVRGDFVRNQLLSDFGFSPDTHDEQVVSRTRLNLSVKPMKSLAGFIQGQFYTRENPDDYSEVNLYQAYVEFSGMENLPVGLKVGRQELSYGTSFFLGPNDFYEGLVWDGGKIKIAPKDNFWVDLIGARYVKLNENTSDNEPALYGAYSSYELTHDSAVDLYFFYHKGGFQFFHTDLPASDKWFTLGTRLAGKTKGGFDYEIEPLYQFGKIENSERLAQDTISAYGGHIEAGYTMDSEHKTRIFTAYAFGSGDNNAQDKKFREFHGNIYNDNYLVGDTSLIPDLSGITVGDARASGMHIFVAGLSLDLTSKLNLNLDNHYLLSDKTPNGISKNLGDEINLITTYNLFENCNIIASANRFFTGKFFEDATGSKKPIDYFYVQTQIEF